MARPAKIGLDYFPFDVDFFDDEKIMLTTARFGPVSEGIIIRLMCRLYRSGYHLKYDDDTALIIARSMGDINLHNLVNDVVKELLKRGFFDQKIYDEFGVLTSRGFQKRYHQICTDAGRKHSEIDPRFDLIGVSQGFSGEKTEFPAQETELSVPKSTQSKVKESKVNSGSSSNLNIPGETENDNDDNHDDDFFLKISDEELENGNLGKHLRGLFGFYCKKTPHPQEVQDLIGYYEDTRFRRRTTWEIMLRAFQDYPGHPKEKQNTRYLLKVIRGRLDDRRDAVLSERKKSIQARARETAEPVKLGLVAGGGMIFNKAME